MRKKKPDKNTDQPNQPAPDPAGLKHTKLERRRLLNADFGFDGSNLLFDNFVDSNSDDNRLSIGDDGTNYLFTLEDGVFDGTDSSEIIGNGTNTLSVDKSVAGLVSIILDSNTSHQFDLEFNDFDFGGTFEISNSSGIEFGTVSQLSGTSFENMGVLDISGALDIDLSNSGNDFNQVSILSAQQVSLTDANSITINGLSTEAGAQISAGAGIDITGDITNGSSGSIVLNANGGDVSIGATVSNTHDISISASDNILFADDGLVSTTDSTTVELTAGDSILDNSTSEDTNVESQTGTLRLDAANGVGSAGDGDLDVEVTGVQFRTTGNIHLTDLGGGLEISEASNADGSANIAANSPLTISANVTVGASSTFAAGNSGLINDDLTIDNNAVVTLNGASQTLTFTAGDDVIFDSGRVVTVGTDNTVVVTADHESGVDADRGSITNAAGVIETIITNNLRLSAADGIGDSGGDAATTPDEALRINADFVSANNSIANSILLTETDSLTVDNTGITTFHSDAKLTTGGDLAINAAIGLQSGNLFLDVGGNVTQTASLTAFSLGMMVDGTTTLQNAANDVNFFAADNGGFTYFTDADPLIIGSVTVDGMNVTGITTSNDDVKLSTGGFLIINEAIDVGTGNLFLDVAGNVTQSASITANGLALMVDGSTTLQNASNDVAIIAAENGGVTFYTDANNLEVGSVAVAGMGVIGITTTGDDAKLKVGGDLLINESINLGFGDMFLDVDGAVSQTASIIADKLGLMVNGDTILQNAGNDINTFAANNGGVTYFTDLDALVIGSVTVDGMTVEGLSTTNDDAKIATNGFLVIVDAINVASGNLFLDVAGDVTQSASITANELGLMVDGNTTLQNPTNDVNTFAANNGGFTYFTDVDALIVGSVTVDGMTVTGISTTNDDVKLTTGGFLVINDAIGVFAGSVFLDVVGDVTQTAAITGNALGLNVDGTTTLTNAANDVNTFAANNTGATYFTDADALIVGSVTVDGIIVEGITTANAETKITADGFLAINSAIDLSFGNLFLDITGNVTQTASITANALGLMVDGNTTLQNASNDVNTLAANNGGFTYFTDVDPLIVGSVTVNGMTVTGITTVNDDVKLTTGGFLVVNETINAGIGNVFLDVAGNVTQTSSISANSLGLMVDGDTVLKNASNNVDNFAANNGGETLYVDADGVTIGSVTVDGMTVTGITTTNDDTKLTVGGNLAINQAIALSAGNLFLDVTGDVTQSAAITANSLGMMVDGTTRLQNAANDVNTIAANNGGFTYFTDVDALIVGSVTVEGMTVTGITTSDDHAKLTAGGFIAINEAIALGTGDLFLDITGNVTQTASIIAHGLGMMVNGNTTLLDAANDVDVLAFENMGITLFNDVDSFAVGTVTVDACNATGLTSSADVKLAVAGDLSIRAAIDVGAGNLFLEVAGNVTQTAAISGTGLGMMVGGTTTLQNAANDFDVFAAENEGITLYTDVDGLIIGTVTVASCTATGIITSNDNAKLLVGGDLAINEVISLGMGDQFLDVTGNVTQTAAITANSLGLMVDGSTRLQHVTNDVSFFAADNGGETLYNDVNDLVVSSVTIDGMTVTGITTTHDDAKLSVGGDLAINEAINLASGDLFLDVRSNVTQTASIIANSLGMMVDGNTRLQDAANDVNFIAANNSGFTYFTDVDNLIVSSVTVDGMTVTGITTSDDNVKLSVGNSLVVNEAITLGMLGMGDLFLDVRGNVVQTAAITANSLGLMVDGTTRLQNPANDVNFIAANNGGFTYFTDVDGLTVSSVSVDGMTVTGITTSDDPVKLSAGGDIAVNEAIAAGSSNLFLDSRGNVTQTAAITANSLGLMVDGTTRLQHASNDVNFLAANNGGETFFNDVNDLTVSSVVVDAMTVTGITTTNDDAKLSVGSNLTINRAISLGSGNLFLDVRGDVTQSDAITANSLGLMIDGDTTLQNAANDVDAIAANNGGFTYFTDVDALIVGTVAVDGMTVTGIATTNDNAKLSVGNDLAINAAISLGTGDLFLDVRGDVTQTAEITANALSMMIDGNTTLQNAANDVNFIAANNGGFTYFTDVDDLTVSSVSVDGMTVTGITTSDANARLSVGGDLAINNDVELEMLGMGDLFLDVRGNVTQTAAITANALGMMVDGTTRLQNANNDVAIIAANNQGETLYTDLNDLTVGTVTVDGVTVTGITTTNDDAKLTAGGNLAINEAISLGTGDLFLDITGNVTQTASIVAHGLGMMVDGNTTLLNAANDVDVLAFENMGITLFNDVDNFAVGTVTVDACTVTGLTSSADVKLAVGGDLAINSAINVGAGNLFLEVTGNVTQTAAISGTGLGMMVGGTTTLQNAANDFDVFAAENEGITFYTDVDGLIIGTVTVASCTATGIITSSDNAKLLVGGDLAINEAITLGMGNLFLDVNGNVTQTAAITANSLGMMVDGNTRLQNTANDVNFIAADNGGFTHFTDVDDLTVSSVTVDGMTVTGITTINNPVKLTTDGDLAINEAIALGTSNLFLDVNGNVTQTASIIANSLGLMVDGTTRLQHAANDVNFFAANNGGETLFNDVDDLIVSNVLVDGMMVTGLTTTNDDAKLSVGGNLRFTEAVNLFAGNLFLDVRGDVTQTASITANSLGMMVDGNTRLQNAANDVNTIAANNGGFTYFTDVDALLVGSVTVDGMTVTGITTTDDNTKLSTGGFIAINEAIALGTGDLFLDARGNVTQTAAITADALGLMVDGTTRLQNAANDVNTIAANNGGETLYRDVNDLAVGSVTVDGMTVTGITTTHDDTKLSVGGDLAISEAINLASGDLFLDVRGNVTQTASIIANSLGMMVDGNTRLQNAANDVNFIAANNGGFTYFTDVDVLIVKSVTVDGMTVNGITTSNDDVKLSVGMSLSVQEAINLSAGNLFLDVRMDVSQSASIVANSLGMMVDGNTRLQHAANDVNFIAANNGGFTYFNDVDNLIVSSVTVDGMTVTGITTSDDGTKLSAGGFLTINEAIALGTGDLFLDVAGDVTQTASITANGLGLMVDGNTRLQHAANDVNVIAANNGGFTYYNDVDDLVVSTVIVDAMTVTGITTTNDNAKLSVGGNLEINESIALGTGDLFLDVRGNVTQTASITANGLGMMVDGDTRLQHADNDVNIIAANNGGFIYYNDVDDLIVSTVTVDGMTVTGITTSDDNAKLSVGGNLEVNEAIAIGTGDLFLDVRGNVTQTAAITANALGLMVDGDTRLQHTANDVNIIAANNGGFTYYNDVNDLIVSSVTVDGMTVTGITTSDDNAKLSVGGNLEINEAIAIGMGDLFLDVRGNVTQTASIVANSLGMMIDGTTRLQHAANDVNFIAANNGGETLYNDVDDLTVSTVSVDGMTVTGIVTSDDNVKLTTGGDLQINEAIAIGTGDLFLDITGNVTQTASIVAHGLGMMVDGDTTLQHPDNDVDVLAFANIGFTLFNDVDDLAIGTVTVDTCTVTGITTNGDVKLSVGADLVIGAVIDVGAGNLFLEVGGNLTQTAAISGTGLGLMVGGNTTLQDAVNDFDIFAAENEGITLYADVDDLTIGTVTVAICTATGIITSDDNTKLSVGGNLIIDEAIAIGTGDLFLDVRGNVTQTAAITANGLGMMVDGDTQLQHAANDVNIIAANNGGFTFYNDVNDLIVSTVTVDGMTVTGITTSDDNAKLSVGGNLEINEAIALGTGDLFLDVRGNVTQTASITANGLGMMVDGDTRLQHADNDVNIIAANNGGFTFYNDVNDLIVSSVTVDGMMVTGIITSDDDTKLSVGGSLEISEAITLGTGDLFLDVRGDVTQTAAITANGLGMMVDGDTRLQHAANDVNIIAANNGGFTYYNDVDDLIVSTVTVDGMTVTGIITSDDNAKLSVGGNLEINEAIALGMPGMGDLFLDVRGNVTQTAAITANGLGMMVDGDTRLQHAANDVNIIAANNGGFTYYNDVDDLIVSTVTVDGMTVTGIITSDDNAKLSVGGNLEIDEAIALGMPGMGDLFLDVRGNVTQTASITANALGMMVDGDTRLQHAANDVNIIAANNGGFTYYNDVNDLIVSTVTVDGMTVTGIITSDDNAKLSVGGNLEINEAISLGTGDLFLDVRGNVTQAAAITANALGMMVDRDTRLQHAANDVNIIAANNGGFTFYNDVNDLIVSTVTVDGMTVTGIITSDDNTKLSVGGNLEINEAIDVGTAELFLDVRGNVTQAASIVAHGLGLMVDGSTTLTNAANDVDILAAENLGSTSFTDLDDVTVGTVTVDGMTVIGVQVTGDLTLVTGGNIEQELNAPVIVSGQTEITTTGHVCFVFGDSINGVSDGLNDNDFNTLLIHTATNADIVDTNDLEVVSTTVNNQLRLAAGDETAGELRLLGDITAADQVLLQASNGVTQSGGIITTDQLFVGGDIAKESTGRFDLQSENVVNELAARVNGDFLFANTTDLNLGVLSYTSVCGSTEAISGLTIDGNMVIDNNATANAAAGNLTQSPSAPVIVTGTSDINASGNIILLGDDRDPFDGGNANDFQGVVNINTNAAFNGVTRNFVEIADINALTVEDATSNQGIHLYAGTSTDSQLELTGQLTSTNVLLQTSDGVTQSTATGVIDATNLILGGDQTNEAQGVFILQGQNQVDNVAAKLLNGTMQLKNVNDLTVSASLSFVGSDGSVTDSASGLFVDADGSQLVFADPNLQLADTTQRSTDANGLRYNPAFGQYLDVTDIGVAIVNEAAMTVESGALVNATHSDVYMQTVGVHDLTISDTVRLNDISNRILVIAGGQFVLEPDGRLERGTEGLITSRFNDVELQDPIGEASDQNRLVNRNDLTQTLQFIFADAFESNFDTSIFWGIQGTNDNTFDFESLTPTQLAALESLLFGNDTTEGFESRSFYDFQVNQGNTSVSLTSQRIGSTFDNSNSVSDARFIPEASFTLDFLRNNAEFRNIVFVFNDANINMFQNASATEVAADGSTVSALEDLNVATADFEGLARFNEPARIVISRPDADSYTTVETSQVFEEQLIQSTFLAEQPLFVQTVQQKFFVVIYFDSQFEADLFESKFGEDELSYQEVIKLLEELELSANSLEWRNSSTDEIDNLDANQIREILNRAGLDLEEDEQWVERFKQWLSDKSETGEDGIPDVPRGLFKILEVDNGKTVIQGDDIDRKFVPEPEDDPQTDPESDVPFDTIPNETESDGGLTSNQPSSRLARWTAMLQGETAGDLVVDAGELNSEVMTAHVSTELDQPVSSAAATTTGAMAGLMAILRKRKSNSEQAIIDEDLQSIVDQNEQNDGAKRNIFSNSSRFLRRVGKSK